MRKVVFLDQCLGGGGAERVMCTIMRSLDPRAFEIHLVIITDLRELKHLVPAYVRVHELGVSNTRKAMLTYIRKIRSIRPEIVYSSSTQAMALSVVARPFCNRYRIISRHSTMPSLERAEGGLRGWRFSLLKKVYREADVVISQTEEMATEICAFYKTPPDKVRTIFNPVDRRYIDDCIARSTNPYSGSGAHLVAIGTLYPPKGFDILINAFALLVGTNSNCSLYIIGRDHKGNKNKLKKLCEQLGVQKHVHFVGYKKNPYSYLKHADLFVLSSRREGIPNVLLEAHYLGCRSVATNCVPVIKRIVQKDFIANVDDYIDLHRKMIKAVYLNNKMPTFLDVALNDDLFKVFEEE